jgi:hypothetical protein
MRTHTEYTHVRNIDEYTQFNNKCKEAINFQGRTTAEALFNNYRDVPNTERAGISSIS